MGEVRVPEGALYGAQTQRAVDNFPVSGWKMPRPFIRALGLIKATAAEVNAELGLLDKKIAKVISEAALQVADGVHDSHFPIDVFQTGSGTSSNMNANEVIATLASQSLKSKVHPNDHVNMGQSSNDSIPTAIHVGAYLEVSEKLLPALRHLKKTIDAKAKSVDSVIKTGRTHLMDAMPIRLSQELSAWSTQVAHGMNRVESTLGRLGSLAQGGTAVGTGINAHPEFGHRFAIKLGQRTGLPFQASDNYFESLSCQDTALELSSQLKTVATGLLKIANDLRWMNSGPQAGLAEIALPSLQPGSSIMPGKVNPVIPESAMMVCAQVMGNDIAITVGGQHGNFQLNVMLPMIAFNLMNSISILASAAQLLADKAISGFQVHQERVAELVEKNPIMVTALNPIIGYEKGAMIAKKAYAENRKVKEVAAENSNLSKKELDQILDPRSLTEGGIKGG